MKLLEERVRHDENLYRVFVKGIWGRVKMGGEFYTSFKRNEHVGKVEYQPKLAVHLTFDFNVYPYMTLLCSQIEVVGKQYEIRVFKEYCLKHPFSTTEAVCKAFVKDYGKYDPRVFYYGDASGKNRTPGLGERRAFDDVEKHLMKYLNHASDRVLRRNPNIMRRRDFMNKLLGNGFQVRLLIDESCKELINDMDYLRLGVDGKLKEIYHDKAVGVSYQKLGHCADGSEYFLMACFMELFREVR